MPSIVKGNGDGRGEGGVLVAAYATTKPTLIIAKTAVANTAIDGLKLLRT